MKAISGKMVAALLIVSVVSLVMMDFADARRGGRGGGRSMSRGGPAASGSFNRSRARPQRSPSQRDFSRGGTSQRPDSRQNRGDQRQGNRQDRGDQRQGDRQDRSDQRQDNMDERQDKRQDRNDQRQENIDERQDFRQDVYDDRREYYDDRNEWYEDRWRRRAFVTAASWSRMNCAYTTVIVNGITYYDCGGVRYERVYRGSEVTYIIVN
jgi:hypothetical protein